MPRTPRKNQWLRASKKCDGRCWYCGAKPEPDDLTVDHATPRSRGGKNWDDNLLPACQGCNNEKGNLTISEYRKFCKVRLVRKLMTLGYGACDLSRRVRVVFWGEGNDSPFGH
jgi:hypothetical protein